MAKAMRRKMAKNKRRTIAGHTRKTSSGKKVTVKPYKRKMRKDIRKYRTIKS